MPASATPLPAATRPLMGIAARAASSFPTRLFPPAWTIEEHNNACFIVCDSTRQALGYFYFEEGPGRRSAAKLLTKDEARRMAPNFAKLPKLLRRSGVCQPPLSPTPRSARSC